MFSGSKPPSNKQFKPPARTTPSGISFTVPAPNGRSQEDRRDASSSGGQGQQDELGQYRPRQHHQTKQQYGSGAHRNYTGGNGFGPSSGKTGGFVDDFDVGGGPIWQGDLRAKQKAQDALGLENKRESAWDRDHSPRKRPIAEASSLLDNIHVHDQKWRQSQADDKERKAKAKQDAEKRKEILQIEERKRLANERDKQPNINALKSSKRTTSTKKLSAEEERRNKAATAAASRQPTKKPNSDDIQDADDDDDVVVVRTKRVVDLKGKGRLQETYVDVSTPESDSKSTGRSKKRSAMDVDALLMPNKVITWKSRNSAAASGSRATIVEVDDSPPRKKAPRRPSSPPAKPKSPSPEPVDLMAMIDEDRVAEVSDDESSDGESADVVAEALGKKRGRTSGTPDPLLWAEEAPVDPSSLCPFCSTPLPEKPTKTLSGLLAYLLDQPNIVDFPTARNPLGKRLPVTQTASFCRLHEEERTVIPDGIARGWPTEIDWAGLPKRIDRQLSQHLSDVITGRQPSSYFEDAKEEWERKGTKMKNLMSEFGSFDVEQPGYYGARGHELIVATLTKLFITDSPILSDLRAAPLDPPAFIRRVLVPETAVQLIKVDLKLPDDEAAREVLRESRAFGRAVWAGGLEGKEEEQKFLREEEERERVEEEGSQEREKEAGKTLKSKGKGKERMTEAERAKEKRKQEKREKHEAIARADEIARNYTVMDPNSSDDDAAPPRRKPSKASGGSSPPPVAPVKRKPKLQLSKERNVATTASTSVSGAGPSDSDDVELVTNKKPRPKPRRPSPSPELSITTKSTSFHKPRSKAPPSSSSDEPLPRANPKTIARTASTSKFAKATSSSKTSPDRSKMKSKSKSKKSAPIADEGSDSDSFLNAEILTDVKKKGERAPAPWDKSKKVKGKGKKGAKSAVDESDPEPPPSSSSDDDDEMDVD